MGFVSNSHLALVLLVVCIALLYPYIFLATPKDTGMTALQPLKFLSVAARKKHTATVIFIHVSG